MSLKVMDGLRTAGYTTAALAYNTLAGIPYQSVAAQVNGTGMDMLNHSELIAIGLAAAVTGAGTLEMIVQESADNTTFANIAATTATFNTANSCQLVDVDWNHPDRKRYARMTAINATNAVAFVATALRVGPRRGELTAQANVTVK